MTTHDFRINGMPITGCKTLERDSHAQFLVRHNIVTTMRIPPCLRASRSAKQTPWDDSQSEALRIAMVPYKLHLNCGKQPRHLYSGGFQKDLHLGKRGGGPCKKILSIFASLVYCCCARSAHGPNILPQRPGTVLNF